MASEDILGPVVFDKLGRQITDGSYIAYGHALGRCAGLRIGKVLRIAEREPDWNNESRVSIAVWGVDDEWDSWEPFLASGKGHLLYPDRTIVLNDDQVPEAYKALLAPVTIKSKAKELNIPAWGERVEKKKK